MTPTTDFNTAKPQPPVSWTPEANDVVLSAALGYAGAGWTVIPVNPFTKVPFLEEWQNRGSKDEAQIREWWKTWPNAMIGALTGPASGFWVLDVDIDEEKGIDGRPVLKAWEREHGKLPTTVVANTPRGGWHYYFRWSEGVRNKAGRREMRGVDWRGEGGFIIVPPSVKADGRAYAWWQAPDWIEIDHAPTWLLDIVLKKPSIAERAQAAISAPSIVGPWSSGRGYGAAALEAECRELAQSPSGCRNDQLNRSAFSLAQLVAGGELGEAEAKAALIEAASACGLIQDDGRPSVDKTIWSGFNAGLQHPRRAPQEAFDASGFGGQILRGERGRSASGAPAAAVPAIRATPFVWRDPSTFPRRQWLYGYQYVRRFVSVLVSPGGIGKSSLALVEALSITTGRALLGDRPWEPGRAWVWNGEDPREETERRVVAAMLHFGIGPEEVEDRLFVDSGRDMPIIVEEMDRTGVKIAIPTVDAVVATMKTNEIDFLVVDPFVSSHRVTENDNMAIDAVAKEWGRVAELTDAAILLVHHSRKTNGAEVTIEDSRGAVALMSAARVGRALNVMTQEEADRADVENRYEFFRADNGKSNLAKRDDKATWFRLVSVPLGNGGGAGNPFEAAGGYAEGDNVGVVTSWEWPALFDTVQTSDLEAVQAKVRAGRYRKDTQAADWVGNAVAEVLGLSIERPGHKSKIKALLRVWLENKALESYPDKDSKGNERQFIRVGPGQ